MFLPGLGRVELLLDLGLAGHQVAQKRDPTKDTPSLDVKCKESGFETFACVLFFVTSAFSVVRSFRQQTWLPFTCAADWKENL